MTSKEKDEIFKLSEKLDDLSCKLDSIARAFRNLHNENMEMIKRLGLEEDYYNHFFTNVIVPSCEKKKKKEEKNDENHI